VFRISVVEGCKDCKERHLMVEGKLIEPWDVELETACELARADLNGRQPVVEIKNLTAISQAGERILMELMHRGVKFRCSGIFTKHLLRQLARRMRSQEPEVKC
jgi:hypothetical protein